MVPRTLGEEYEPWAENSIPLVQKIKIIYHIYIKKKPRVAHREGGDPKDATLGCRSRNGLRARNMYWGGISTLHK